MAKILWIRWYLRFFAVTLLLAGFAGAQPASSGNSGSAATPRTVEDLLHQISDQAQIVFIGQVVAIHPHELGGAAPGLIEIDFSLTQAIRGCPPGETYILREWAGLWAGNAHRYHVGQSLLMMLYAPGPSGMSSPVGGMEGAIPLREVENVSTPSGNVQVSAAASASQPVTVADLRWLGAKLPHSVSYKLQSALSATPLTLPQEMSAPSAVTTEAELITHSIAPEGDSSSRTSIPVQQASVDALVRLLISWQKATSDAH